MNYSQREVKRRARRLQSPADRRLHKLRLIGLRILLAGFIFGVCFCASILFGSFHAIISSAPDIQSIQIVPQGYTTTILDTKGNSIQTLVGRDANREYVSLEQIPASLQNAFVAIEDERFWTHNGIDLQGILRAAAVGVADGGDFSQGASTLTQQLLKNQVFGGGEEKTLYDRIRRKLQEQYLAVQLETKYTKSQILEYYLNTINLGQNTLGVQAASKRYFNKDVSELSLSEAAVLAGITKNPSAYNPISHPNKNQSRRTTVLTSMREQGTITAEEYNEAIKDDVYARIQKVNRETAQASRTTSYFTDALIEQVAGDLKSRLGYTETQAYNALYSGGLTIYSTQDTSLQKICDTVINDRKYYPADSKYQLSYQLTLQRADGSEKNYDFQSMKAWYKKQKSRKIPMYYSRKSDAKKLVKAYKNSIVKAGDTIIAESVHLVLQPQVSFVLMDQSTGRIKALCGGRGRKTGSRTLNRATASTRQPGSTFKVLSTYLPALDTAGMTLATVEDDSKYYYPGTKRLVKNWYGSSYRGLTPLRTAIADSMNVIAVKTLEQVTPKTGYDYLLNLNFTTLVDNYTDSSGATYTDIALPMALGGLTKGVTNLELTTGFSAIAGGGVYHPATFYTKILDHDGNVLLENKPKESGRQVMKDSTAWLLTSAMQDVITKGTGTLLKFQKSNMPLAGKTGTSTGNRDLWFVGYTPYLTAGIWAGYDASDKQSSSSYHKIIWRTIMERINRRYKRKTFTRPSSVTSAVICTKCGKRAIDGVCENAVGGSCVRTEYFARDSVPTENCDCHVRCRICKSSGHLAGDNCPYSQIYTAVYLQQKTPDASVDETADAPLIIPSYLSNSLCEVHN